MTREDVPRLECPRGHTELAQAMDTQEGRSTGHDRFAENPRSDPSLTPLTF
jgi:hypothetical protein